MGRRAELDLTLRTSVDIDRVFEELGKAGWSAIRDGRILHMSGDHDWNFADAGNYGTVREELERTLANGDDAAISLWTAEGVGVNLMFRPGMTRINVGLDLSRRTLGESSDLTDLPWYLSELLPSFARLGLIGVVTRDEYED